MGKSIDEPTTVNLVDPVAELTLMTDKGPMKVNMKRVAEVAKKLGVDKFDLLSIPGHRNARGELVPDYDLIRLERKAGEQE